jgi:hypothetical protein
MSTENEKPKKVVPMPPPDKDGTVFIQKGLNEKLPERNIIYHTDGKQIIRKIKDK